MLFHFGSNTAFPPLLCSPGTPKTSKRKRRRKRGSKEAENVTEDLPQSEAELRAAAEAEEQAEAAAEQREKDKIKKQLASFEHATRVRAQRLAEMNESDKAELIFGGRHRPVDITDWVKRWGNVIIGRSVATAMMKRPVFALFYEKDVAVRKSLAMQHYLGMRAMLGLPEQLRQRPIKVPGPRLIGKDRFVFQPKFGGIPAWNLAPETVTTDELEGYARSYLNYGVMSIVMPPESWKLIERSRPRLEWELRHFIAFLKGEEFTEESPELPEPFHSSGYDSLPISESDAACLSLPVRRNLMTFIQEEVPPLTHPDHPGYPITAKGYMERALKDHKDSRPVIIEACYQQVAKYRSRWIPERLAEIKNEISFLQASQKYSGVVNSLSSVTSFLGIGESLRTSLAPPTQGIESRIKQLEQDAERLKSQVAAAEALYQIVIVEQSMSATDAMKKLFPESFMDERALKALRRAEAKLRDQQRLAKMRAEEIKRLNRPDLPPAAVPPKWLVRRWQKELKPERFLKVVSRVKRLYQERKDLDARVKAWKSEQLAEKLKRAAEQKQQKEAAAAAANEPNTEATPEGEQKTPPPPPQ